MVLALILTLLAVRSDDDTGNTWAVLVAGSRGYYNYRHQSDVCHAYHLLSDRGGIPDERMIVMMADDIANSDENPFKGNMINMPNGTNVYPGVKKDYTGPSVNKHTFFSVLKGQASENVTTVLNSTEIDNVFIYFTDHGASGLICLPYGDEVYADELIAAIKYMHDHKMYKKLVFYLESCESGSMFEKLLPSDLNVYAVTAAGAGESSYACYWDNQRNTYLADQWSINFLRDSDKYMLKNETLDRQFATVLSETFASTSHRYGSLDFRFDQVEMYQGQSGNFSRKPAPVKPAANCSLPVSSRDVVLESLKRRWEHAKDPAIKNLLEKEIENETARRVHVEYTFRNIVDVAVGKTGDQEDLPKSFDEWMDLHPIPNDFDGMRSLNKAFKRFCFEFDSYSYQFFTILVSLNEKLGKDATSIVKMAIQVVCQRQA